MRRPLTPTLASIALMLVAWLHAEEPKKNAPGTAPQPALAPVEDVPGLPRVLLMGDSISMGYTLPVRTRLQGRANIHHPPENCGDTGRGLRRLEAWLGTGRWDVIYFNFGLHDLKYLDAQGNYVPPEKGAQVTPLPQYEANLRELVTRLRRTGAKLIYATTTPVPTGTLGRVAHDELAYNAVARRVMQETGVTIDDLHGLATARQGELQLRDNVHFTPQGYEQLAARVASSVTTALSSAGP
ncbi:MAG TPA: SGNH/GDSL hydrolase family protein [Lacunisphaera sp.]